MDSQRQAAGDAGTRPLWFGPHEPRSTPLQVQPWQRRPLDNPHAQVPQLGTDPRTHVLRITVVAWIAETEAERAVRAGHTSGRAPHLAPAVGQARSRTRIIGGGADPPPRGS